MGLENLASKFALEENKKRNDKTISHVGAVHRMQATFVLECKADTKQLETFNPELKKGKILILELVYNRNKNEHCILV